MTKIWTLDTRDTVLLDVVMQHSQLSYADLGPELRMCHARTVEMLGSKGVSYEALRSALVPNTEPELADLALVFDTARFDESWYGMAIAERVLPQLERDWSGSILEGDLISRNEDRAFRALRSSLGARVSGISTTRQLFVIYLTNLNKRRKEKLVKGLLEYEPFFGSIETHYESWLKDWLSLTLTNSYLKHGTTFIGPHESDIEEAAERNLRWWPLDQHGYRCVSLPSDLHFDLFLSYKIERGEGFHGSESDTLHGLSTISDDPQELGEFTVFVDPRKVDYGNGKGESVQRLGIALTDGDASRYVADSVVRAAGRSLKVASTATLDAALVTAVDRYRNFLRGG